MSLKMGWEGLRGFRVRLLQGNDVEWKIGLPSPVSWSGTDASTKLENRT